MANGSFSQADADELSDNCGGQRSWLQVIQKGTVRFEPPSDVENNKDTYEKAACVLTGIKKAGVAIGFVGNEQYAMSGTVHDQEQ